MTSIHTVALTIALLAPGFAQTPVPARTSDGQPDLQGMYTRNGVVGLEAKPPENPIDPSGNHPLWVPSLGHGLDPYTKISADGANVLRGGQRRQQRRSGIVDPPDKNLPWRPE